MKKKNEHQVQQPLVHPVDPTLRKEIEAIPNRGARELGLLILEDQWVMTEEKPIPHLGRWRMKAGLGSRALVCLFLMKIEKERSLNPKGYGRLADELIDLSKALRAVCGKLNSLSPTAIDWINRFRIPQEDSVDDIFRMMHDKWVKSEADDIIQEYIYVSDPQIGKKRAESSGISKLAIRLQDIYCVLDYLAAKSKEMCIKKPGAKRVLEQLPVDKQIMDSCADVLSERGHNLTHLSEIASAVYRWGMGEDPPPSWAERKEKAAKKEHTPPKKDGGRYLQKSRP